MSSPPGPARSSGSDFRLIPIDQLELGDRNVRKRDITADLDELAYSMKTFGLQQPIVVQPKNGGYEIIIGQRRYLAAKQLGWPSIIAKVLPKSLDEFHAKVVSFSENVQRRDLSPRDKADTCSYLLGKLVTPRAVAEHLGLTEPTVRKWLDYASVPEELKQLVEQNVITRPEATRLFQYIPDVDKAVSIGKRMKEIRAPKPQRERVFASVEESPTSSVDTIFRRAEEKRNQKTITFVLPEKWASAIDKAASRLGASPNDIARDATIEWLQMLKY